MSFAQDKIASEGITFDDVLLLPAYSKVLPREVSIKSHFSRNIQLNTPIVSAAMDTVTEEQLAITIAREGGIGVIHKNMPLEEQARQVKRVKRAESVMIHEPITIRKEGTVNDALNLMKEYKIGGIPVVDENNVLIGIVTNRDLRFQQDMDRAIEEVMTVGKYHYHHPQHRTWPKQHRSCRHIKLRNSPWWIADHKLIGLITYKDITKSKDRPNSCKG